jgi:2-keto-4-pentenoate hydratase/2-oxohepta-3-ene-1,7-dioic acid hydratase in catechol pathway
MKIVTFRTPSQGTRVGASLDGEVIDLNLADPRIPGDLRSLIAGGEPSLDLVRAVVDEPGAVPDNARHALDDVALTAPWTGGRVAMAGSNSARHVLEAIGKDPKTWHDHLAPPGAVDPAPATIEAMTAELREAGPWGFWKNLAWVTNPGESLPYPRRTQHLDYEGEVAIVFAKPAKDIRAEDLKDHVWGVTLLNDWTDRDAVGPSRPLNYNLPKNFDGSLTIGPCIVIDELDLQNIEVTTRVNGELRQQFTTAEMVFSFGECAEYLTRDLTFGPGDMLGGGTGAGTAIDIVGRANMSRPEAAKWFLHPGDRVEVSSPQVGAFENTVADRR